jgi:4-amino-4-deoxy-L-arabinose transferase-like glycosyltransferase
MRWRLVAILVLAAGLRLAWILLVPNAQYSDSVWYDAAAWNLASHGVYGPDVPSAWFPPGYPFLLTALYALVGHNESMGKLANVVLGVAATGFVYLLARLFLSETVALVSALLVAVWPNLIFSTGVLGSDLLPLCGLIACMWLGMRRTFSWPHAILLGLLVGWMILARPVSGILLVALALWWWLDRHSLRPLVPVTLVAATIVGAWTLRNYVEFQQPILIATNGGYNFWQTNQRYADGNDTYWSVVPMDDPEYQTMYYGDEFTKNSAGYRYGVAYLQAHPLHPIEMLPTKLFWLYHTDTSGFYEGVNDAPMDGPSPIADFIKAHSPVVEALTFRYYEALLLLAGVGIFISFARGRPKWLWPLISLPILLTFFHLFFHAKDRFHMPLDGIIAIFAGIALVELWHLVRVLMGARTPSREPARRRAAA